MRKSSESRGLIEFEMLNRRLRRSCQWGTRKSECGIRESREAYFKKGGTLCITSSAEHGNEGREVHSVTWKS